MFTTPKLDGTRRNHRRWLALSLPLLCIIPRPAAGQQNTAPSPRQAPLAYDIAVIRENASDEHGRSHIYGSPDSLTFRAVNVPLLMLLHYTFGLPDTQILNVPPALGAKHFDIEAKVDPTLDTATHLLTSDQRNARKQAMLQALFADRFALKFHPETRDQPIYLLTAVKTGPKLQPGKGDHLINESRSRYSANGITIAVFAEMLARQTGRVVFDRTGLTGIYDLTLTWSPEDATPTDSSAPSLFIAIQEQLGLKLEPARGPVPVIVVDHIEPPSPN